VPVPSTGEGPPEIAYPLAVQATVQGQTLEAELLDASGQMRYQGVVYRSPSRAGQVAAGWKSCNGWRFWQYWEPGSGEWRAIDALRE
jgi:hypothetical protein